MTHNSAQHKLSAKNLYGARCADFTTDLPADITKIKFICKSPKGGGLLVDDILLH
jgi:hypothetical protein